MPSGKLVFNGTYRSIYHCVQGHLCFYYMAGNLVIWTDRKYKVWMIHDIVIWSWRSLYFCSVLEIAILICCWNTHYYSPTFKPKFSVARSISPTVWDKSSVSAKMRYRYFWDRARQMLVNIELQYRHICFKFIILIQTFYFRFRSAQVTWFPTACACFLWLSHLGTEHLSSGCGISLGTSFFVTFIAMCKSKQIA